MFGGGQASGREIVSYMTINGPVGGFISITFSAAVFSLVVFMCYEIARIHSAYNYQSYAKAVLGKRGWIGFEIVLLLALLLVLAYAATAGGTAVANHFGFQKFWATGALLCFIVYLTFQGRRIVELTMVGTTVALLASTIVIAGVAGLQHGETISTSLRESEFSLSASLASASRFLVAVTAFTPILLYAARDLRSRNETIVAGICCGVAIMLPSYFMHTAFLTRFPEVLSIEVPNAWIVAELMPHLFGSLFVVILFIAIAQTGVATLQGLIERIDSWSLKNRGRPLNNISHAGISGGVLLICLALSPIGVIELLYRIYDIIFWLFLVFFTVPLFTIGTYIIAKSPSGPIEK